MTRAAATVATAVLVVSCGTPESVDAPAGAPAAAEIRSVIDPRWMGVGEPDRNWRLLSRDIERDRQVFGLQPIGETMDFPNCSGCNHAPVTAQVTIYAKGAYDRAAVSIGEPVTVNGADGYHLAPRWPAGALLAWRYDTDAWVTVHGMSAMSAEPDRLLDLAAQVRPTDRTAFRFPLRLDTLPSDMPLSGVQEFLDGGTSKVFFDGCGRARFAAGDLACPPGADTLSITYAARDDFSTARYERGRRHELFNVPVTIGGRDGFLLEGDDTAAAIKAAPGVVVEFAYSGSADRFRELLTEVVWPPDLDDESTWPAVDDWT